MGTTQTPVSFSFLTISAESDSLKSLQEPLIAPREPSFLRPFHSSMPASVQMETRGAKL